MKDNYQNDEFLRKRKARQKQIRKRRAKVTVILLLVLLLITGVILSVTVLFPIKNITASGSKIYAPSEIVEACEIEQGENLIAASKSKALKSLKSKLPFVEDVDFDRSLPDTLNIKVTDAKEYTCYKVGKRYYTVSESGWVLKEYKKQPKSLTLIISDKVKCKTGTEIEFSDTSLKEICENVESILHKYNLTPQYINVTDKTAIEAKVDGRFLVNFGSTKDFEPKVKHLIAMMEEIGENDTGKINLSMWNSQNTQGSFVKIDIK